METELLCKFIKSFAEGFPGSSGKVYERLWYKAYESGFVYTTQHKVGLELELSTATVARAFKYLIQAEFVEKVDDGVYRLIGLRKADLKWKPQKPKKLCVGQPADDYALETR